MSFRLIAAAWLAAMLSSSAWAAGPDFNREVRPILSAHCFKCHGPDDNAREADLRLDDRAAATKQLDSGLTAIVPGKPDASELVRRIFAADEDERMPPRSANKPLSAQQKQILQDWIAAGAEYEPHWAFVPPQIVGTVPVPPDGTRSVPTTLPDGTRSVPATYQPIDAFTLSRLHAAGLSPSPEADRYTLVRRVYLDLIGLLPTPEEADAFVNDKSPDAFERLVDRLLSSPHYGERWARRWLDLARYADTNGYEKDRVRSIWPYRDWVIGAINADLPFDQFTVEQLAGDMLPEATLDQRIATGFHRNTMINEEGGIDPLEFRYHAMVDRANTTASVWLGLTLGCAQCHTHKFDPVPHEDYYRQLALLNNADEPTIDVPTPELAARRTEIERQIARLEADLPNRFPLEGQFRWLTATADTIESAGGALAEKLDDGSVRFGGTSPATDTYTLEFESNAKTVTALRLETLADPRLPAKGPGRAPHGNFVVSEISVIAAPLDKPDEARPVKLVRAAADFAQDGFPPENAFDGKPKTGWAIHGPGDWNVDRSATFHFESPVELPDGGRWKIKIDQQHGSQHTVGRLRLSLGEELPSNDERPETERRREHLETKYAAWLEQKSKQAAAWTLLQPSAARSDVPTLTIEEGGTIFVSGDMTKRDVYEVTYEASALQGITAIRLEALPDDRLPGRGPGRIYYEGPFGDFWLSEISLMSGEQPLKFKSASHSFASGNNRSSAAIDGDPQSGWSINGGQGRAHWATFQLEQPLDEAGALELKLLFERYYAAGLGKFRVWATTASLEDFTTDLPTEVENILGKPADQRTDEDTERLMHQFLATAPELAAARSEIDGLRRSLPAHPTTLVMQERPRGHTRPTFVHHRGEFLQPKDNVEPGILSIFPPLGENAEPNRLEFARWLVSDANPLVGRVTMNRHWAALFGTGIVRTVEDFGYQGEPPSHPDLLDWLAVEFTQNRGWSIKSMHRLIVTSGTYRQSAEVQSPKSKVQGQEAATLDIGPSTLDNPNPSVIDPANRLLWHFPRSRLEAEQVRDAALSASGLLTHKLGGPSVFPPQPPGITSEGAYGPLAWNVSSGGDRYRRGLYTFAKRTAPYAMFATFDGPSGEACVAHRDVTNTPLQALTMLNDEVVVEAAQALGRDVAHCIAATSGRASPEVVEHTATDLFRRCLTRPPTDEELQLLVEFYDAQKKRLAARELDAEKIGGSGDGDAVERAAWTLVARAVLNLDEFIMK